MKVKRYVLLFILVLMSNMLFASRRLETFTIYNYSSKEIRVKVEYWGEPIIVIYDNPLTQKEIEELEFAYKFLKVDKKLELPKKNETYIPITRFAETKKEHIIERYNNFFDIVEYVYNERIHRLPFMEKMKAIIKKLEISCDDGKRIITLDDLGNQIIKRTLTGATDTVYILEIFDYDLEGKPASEW